MNVISKIRRRLGLKLFISYLIIIITGIIVLAVSAEFVIPSAFNRHMGAMMGDSGMMGGMMMDDMSTDLYSNFRSAMGEALLRAGLAAFMVAVGVSIFISRRVVSPVQEMTTASQYIAEGHYDLRVQVPGDVAGAAGHPGRARRLRGGGRGHHRPGGRGAGDPELGPLVQQPASTRAHWLPAPGRVRTSSRSPSEPYGGGLTLMN